MATGMEKVIDRQDWLQTVETVMQQVADTGLNWHGAVGQQVVDFLHGTWLGHPLHPVLTDIPVGAWTAATVLDVHEMITGDTTLGPGADAVIGIGLIGAAGAAVTGLNDWKHTSGTTRRVGALHALLNAGATSLFLGSWLARRSGNRTLGHVLGLAGFSTAMASSYLGGKLVYNERMGVDHSPRKEFPADFTPVMAADDLPQEQPYRTEINGVSILLVRRGDRVFALSETCSHLGGPLSEGELEGDAIRCPWHGSLFSLETGEVLEGPSTYDQPCMEARIRNGQIEVRLQPAEVTQSIGAAAEA